VLIYDLIKWYSFNKRALPWRETNDPYKIWISEVILQQTRVNQGLPYYHRILEECPDIHALAKINRDKFYKIWQGLGYYSRAENVLNTANELVATYNGQFPESYTELIGLKGIGPYTAAAISSIAFNKPHAVLDGNVYRVLSRLFSISEPINSSKSRNIFSEIADNLIDQSQPGISNQALMELGALICLPKNPNCNECPLKLHCSAYKDGTTSHFPVKIKKKKPEVLYHYYLIPVKAGKIPLKKRTSNAIWKNLFEPPCVVTKEPLNETQILHMAKNEWFISYNNKKFTSCLFKVKHQLTHITIHAEFWIFKDVSLNDNYAELFSLISLNDIENYPVHRLFDKFLTKHMSDLSSL